MSNITITTDYLGSGLELKRLYDSDSGRKINVGKVSGERDLEDCFQDFLDGAQAGQRNKFMYRPSPIDNRAFVVEFGVCGQERFHLPEFVMLCGGVAAGQESGEEPICSESWFSEHKKPALTFYREELPREYADNFRQSEQMAEQVLAAEEMEDLSSEVKSWIIEGARLRLPEAFAQIEYNPKGFLQRMKEFIRARQREPITISKDSGIEMTFNYKLSKKRRVDEFTRTPHEADTGFTYRRIIAVAPKEEGPASLQSLNGDASAVGALSVAINWIERKHERVIPPGLLERITQALEQRIAQLSR